MEDGARRWRILDALFLCDLFVPHVQPQYGATGLVVVRAGTLDESEQLAPELHLWTSRKQPWVALPARRSELSGKCAAGGFHAAVRAAREGGRTVAQRATLRPEADGAATRVGSPIRVAGLSDTF